MEKLPLPFLLFLLALMGCQRMDSNLFNQQKVETYLYDDYPDEVDGGFHLPDTFNIHDSLIFPFILKSVDADGSAYDIHAVYLGMINEIPSDTIILYCHGNKNHMDYYWERAKLLANTGAKNRFGVLMFDYRGYGMSEGEPSEAGVYADTRAALKWLSDRGAKENQLVIYGYSLGSAAATELTFAPEYLRPEKIILEAPFASTEVMVQDAGMLSWPASYFTNTKVDNANKIKTVSQPLLWLHGVDDDFLAIESHGELVYKNHQGLFKEAVRVEGAVHNNVPLVLGFENYLRILERFIEK